MNLLPLLELEILLLPLGLEILLQVLELEISLVPPLVGLPIGLSHCRQLLVVPSQRSS